MCKVNVRGRLPSPPERKPCPIAPYFYVKLYPEVCEAALKARLDLCLRVWTAARGYDITGEGRIPVDELVYWYRNFTGMSAERIRKILYKGEGKFWTVTNGTIWLFGVRRVAQLLGIAHLSYPREMEMPTTLQSWRAACTFSQFAGKKMSNPISQAALAKSADRCDRTIRNYDKALGDGLKKEANYAPATVNSGKNTFLRRINGNLCLVRQLPNSYRLSVAWVGRRGMVRKVNRELAHSPLLTARRGNRRLYVHDWPKTFPADGEYLRLRVGDGLWIDLAWGHGVSRRSDFSSDPAQLFP